jgi:hypothetical protein
VGDNSFNKHSIKPNFNFLNFDLWSLEADNHTKVHL